MSRTPARRGGAGPLLGENTLEVLGEAGYGREDVARLVAAKVVRIP
jgi:formyl-CoA transferase